MPGVYAPVMDRRSWINVSITSAVPIRRPAARRNPPPAGRRSVRCSTLCGNGVASRWPSSSPPSSRSSRSSCGGCMPGITNSTDDAFIDTRTVQISAQVAAAIVNVPVTDNQLVEAGTELVRLDDRDYVAQRDQAQANVDNLKAQIAAQQAKIDQADKQVAQAQATLTFAQQEADRYEQLAKQEAPPPPSRRSNTIQTFCKPRPLSPPRRPTPSATEKQDPVLRAQLDERASAAGTGRHQSVAHHHYRAGRRPGDTIDRGQGRLGRGRPGADDVRAAPCLGHRQFQGDPTRPDAARPAGQHRDRRLSGPHLRRPCRQRSSRQRHRVQPVAGAKTPPAITSRSCSACRSRSYSTSRRTCCWVRACRSCRPSKCDERSGAAGCLEREPLGSRRPQSLAGRGHRFDRHFHGRARYRDRQCVAALHRRQPRRQRRREHLGGHDLSDRQCGGAAGERLAVERPRPQTLLHDLRGAVHDQLAVLRRWRRISAR